MEESHFSALTTKALAKGDRRGSRDLGGGGGRFLEGALGVRQGEIGFVVGT